MLQLRETRILRTDYAPIASGVTIEEEGIALAYVKENGETKVRPSTGAPNEIFAGVSLSRNTAPGFLPYVEEQVIPTGLSVTLVRTPVAGQLYVEVDGVGKTVVTTTPSDATEVQLSGSNLIFFAGENNKTVRAQYHYVPSVTEARAVLGDVAIGGLGSAAVGMSGILKNARFGTNFYDASVDWTSALFVKLAAGGKFTVGAANDHIPGATVLNTPNEANPFLVLNINVA